MTAPKEGVDELERGTELPIGNEERFVGHWVMGGTVIAPFVLDARRDREPRRVRRGGGRA